MSQRSNESKNATAKQEFGTTESSTRFHTSNTGQDEECARMESGSGTNVLTTHLVIPNHPGGPRFRTHRQSACSLIFNLQDHDISSNYVHPSVPALDHASILQPYDKSRPVPRRPSEMLLCNLESRKLNPHTNQFHI
jgi:hypothetical protein